MGAPAMRSRGSAIPLEAVSGTAMSELLTALHPPRPQKDLSSVCSDIRSSDILAAMSGPRRGVDDVLESFAIARASPIPLWFQVAQHLEQAITSGNLPQGTLLDNEIALAQRLGVSRPTMRRAMQQLVGGGLVARRRGIGTRVIQPKVRRPIELTSLHDDLSAGGQSPTTAVLRFESIGAVEEVADQLG